MVEGSTISEGQLVWVWSVGVVWYWSGCGLLIVCVVEYREMRNRIKLSKEERRRYSYTVVAPAICVTIYGV